MPQTMHFIDCRGLSAPLTVLRIKQAVVGRSDCGLPLDVLVDRDCCDTKRVAACLTGDIADTRLVYFAGCEAADELLEVPVRETPRHV